MLEVKFNMDPADFLDGPTVVNAEELEALGISVRGRNYERSDSMLPKLMAPGSLVSATLPASTARFSG